MEINKTNTLSIEDVIRILSNEKISFKAEIKYFGEDTNFECVEFTLSNEYYSFNYYLDIDIHGHTIEGGKDYLFYTPKNKEDFLKLVKIR